MICTSTTSYRRKKWLLPTPAPATEELAAKLNLPPIVAQLLLNRGLTDAGIAADFLDPKFRDLHPPQLLPNIDRAAARIAAALRAGEKITLYGDYDVDGITGTAMLWHTLHAAPGINPNTITTYIPHRVDEGYGLNTDAIDQLIDTGTKLLITVDCGCSAIAPITHAKNRGIDTIISDHHEFAPTLPPAYAIVHPRLPASNSELRTQNSGLRTLPYPNPDLCGAGVAFKLAWAIAQKICNSDRVSETYRNLLLEFSALAGLGTIADVVPLTGENRILAKYGLAQLARTQFLGLRALILAAGYGEGTNDDGTPLKKIDCMAVGFTLAPRLNAAGRMGHAKEAVELLTTATGPRADEIATWLEKQNRDRQTTERKMVDIAKAQVESALTASLDPAADPSEPRELPHILVVAHESFHAGVVGIVASRLVDQYHRPAFVLAKTAPTPGTTAECHGSARSIDSFELHHAIDHVRDLITSGGGHAMAGGVRLPLANLEAFRERLNNFAKERLTEEQLIPALDVDAILPLADCIPRIISLIEKLEPFGRGNPKPRFLLQNVRISAPPRRVGKTGDHLQLTISRPPHVARCIAFRMGDLEPQLPMGTELNLIVEPKTDTWQGRPKVDLVVVDIARANDEPFTQ